MVRNKLTKVLVTCLMSVFVIGAASITVHAESVRETEPNDTMETAETLIANHETAAQAANGQHPNQHVVKGSTSKTDDDWFKVYLSAGTQYVTCNDDSFEFEVYDPNGNLILEQLYIKTGFGVTAYPFTALTEGYYYVKITGITSSSSDYILLVGGPTYSVASCKVELDTVTMENSRDGSSNFDLRFEDALPENAVVYTILMGGGIRTTAVESVSVRNLSSNNTVNLTTYSWDKSGLAYLNLPLKSRWSITYGYSKDISFTPSIKLYYVYPVVSTFVEDDIVIIQ